MFLDQFLDEIRSEYGEDVYIDNYYGYGDAAGSASFIEELLAQSAPGSDGEAAIAVVYVEGTILQAYSNFSPLGSAGPFSCDRITLPATAADH